MNLRKKISIGKLDRQISLQRANVTPDDYNDQVKTWAEAFTNWAHVTHRSAAEPQQADREVSRTKTYFIVRQNANTKTITAADIIRHENKDYEIEGIYELPDSRRRYFEIVTILIE